MITRPTVRVEPVGARVQRRGRRALTTMLFILVAVVPTRGQALAPSINVVVDGGIVRGAAADGHASEASAPQVTWLGGVTALTRPMPMGRGWNFRADAALRREPAFAMARVGASVAPAYLDALTAASAIRFTHTSASFEAAIVGRFAETRLDRDQRVMRAANTIDNWAFLVDAVVDVRWQGRRGTPAVDADRSLSSIVRAYAGVQHNQRLHRAGDLQDFDDPTGRIEGGIFVTPWRHRNIRGETVMVAGGGVDVETAIRGGERLPSGFRVVVRAEIDVRHARQAWR